MKLSPWGAVTIQVAKKLKKNSYLFERVRMHASMFFYALQMKNSFKDSGLEDQPLMTIVSWLFRCRVCSQILPAFCRLSNNFPKLTFVYADIDECPETTQHIRYTPTFQFYRNGEKVDEMYGTGEERLHDRLWLHS